MNGGFGNSYEIAYANLVGTIPQINDIFNYKLTSATAGTALADGAFINRHFKANEFEWYVQDAWRVMPNLTITFGLRHTILQTPYETSGQQVTPTIDTHNWYLQSESRPHRQVRSTRPILQFAPAGPSYGKPGFWPKSKDNFAPRFAIAYSPDTKTSIRARCRHLLRSLRRGARQYLRSKRVVRYEFHRQQSRRRLWHRRQRQTPTLAALHRPADLPHDQRRRGAQHTLRSPIYAPLDNFAITWGLDSKIKTPYSETFDLSVQREIPGGFTARDRLRRPPRQASSAAT